MRAELGFEVQVFAMVGLASPRLKTDSNRFSKEKMPQLGRLFRECHMLNGEVVFPAEYALPPGPVEAFPETFTGQLPEPPQMVRKRQEPAFVIRPAKDDQCAPLECARKAVLKNAP